MINILPFLKQKILPAVVISLIPIGFVGGFYLHRYLVRDAASEIQRLKQDLNRTETALEKLRQDYAHLEADRGNVLIQTKRLILDKNRLTELEGQYKSLSDAHEAVVKRKGRLEPLYGALRQKHQKTATELKQARATIDGLQSQIKELSQSNQKLQKELAVKVEKAPEYQQLKSDYNLLERKDLKLEQDQKHLDKTVERLKKDLGKMHDYEEKYNQAKREIKELQKENRRLVRKLENAPKEFKQLSRENKTLVKEGAQVHYNLGVFYAENKRFDLAIKEFKKATDLDPLDSRVHYNLGFLYAQHIEDHKLADKHFREYLDIDPDEPGADWVRNYLETRKVYDAKPLKV